ncbi:LuxR C-terminal-related transcriptional regulator [Streptomyces sp. NPDC048277]|uniref:LuxR C-terminal-related transcriptional regulator n=1 Tax=Streptomyces sp. NPDC048277 TaxID=3155027 RepID=UPI0033E86F44
MDDDVPADRHQMHRAVRDALARTAELTREPGLLPARGALDLRLADAALHTAERLLAARLAGPGTDDEAQRRLAALLIAVQAVRGSVRQAELSRRSAAVGNVREALHRLQSVTTLAELVQQVPVEAGRLGYRRALISRLQGGDWTAQAAFADEDPWLTAELVRIGSTSPGRLGRELPETEVVRRRVPVLVRDAQSNPRVHRELVTLSGTRCYVAAPLVARGEVVALVHADQHQDSGTVDSFDRELLGLFAEGLGLAFERVYCQEQLRALRNRLEDQARFVGDVLDGVLGPAGPPEAVPAPPPAPPVSFQQLRWPLSELTRRELDVLQHLCAGESNAEAAAKLYVSVETVKTHVKSVLRKLGAANRAEAVALVKELTGQVPAPSR